MEVQVPMADENTPATRATDETTTDGGSTVATQRGAPLECGNCREKALWDPLKEEYRCPQCGVSLD